MQLMPEGLRARSTLLLSRTRRSPRSGNDDSQGDEGTRKGLGLGPGGVGVGRGPGGGPSPAAPGPPSAPPAGPPGQTVAPPKATSQAATSSSPPPPSSTSSTVNPPPSSASSTLFETTSSAPAETTSSTSSETTSATPESTTVSIALLSLPSQSTAVSFTLSPTPSSYTLVTRTASPTQGSSTATSQVIAAGSNKPSTAAVAVGLTIGILTFIVIFVAAFIFIFQRRKRAQPEPTPVFEQNAYAGPEMQAGNFLNPQVFPQSEAPLDSVYQQPPQRNPTSQSSRMYRSVLDNPLAQHPVSLTPTKPVSGARKYLAAALAPKGTPGPPTPPPKQLPTIMTTSPSSSHFSIRHPQPMSAQARMFHETWGNIRSQRPTPVQGEARSSLHITIANGRLVKEGRPASWLYLDPSDAATTIHSSAGPSVDGNSRPQRWSQDSISPDAGAASHAPTGPTPSYSPL